MVGLEQFTVQIKHVYQCVFVCMRKIWPTNTKGTLVQIINSENRGGRESLKVMELEKGEGPELIKKHIPGDHRGSRAADRGKQTRGGERIKGAAVGDKVKKDAGVVCSGLESQQTEEILFFTSNT